MLNKETDEAIDWGNKAIDIARMLGDNEILTHALNNVGTAQWKIYPLSEGINSYLTESLEIALENSLHEHAARAYTNIISNSITCREYEIVQPYLQEGLQYCEERDLDFFLRYKLSWKAKLLLDKGKWNEAVSVCENLLRNENQTSVVKIGALFVLATIRLRRGGEDALPLLQEAKSLAFSTKEYQRIIPVIVACLEYEWLTGKIIISEEELTFSLALMRNTNQLFQNSDSAFWLRKARNLEVLIPEMYKPYELLQSGKVREAAFFWENLACPYEQAFALFEGNEDDKRQAIIIIQQLGANAVSEKLQMEMRSSGIKKIPRGLRESTINNPAQLTNRELDILLLLKKAIHNKEIAASLFISPKTVDHHVSSILFKLDVNSRSKAVAEAIRLGIIN